MKQVISSVKAMTGDNRGDRKEFLKADTRLGQGGGGGDKWYFRQDEPPEQAQRPERNSPVRQGLS